MNRKEFEDKYNELTRNYKLNELIKNIYSYTLMTKKDSEKIIYYLDKINEIYGRYNEEN